MAINLTTDEELNAVPAQYLSTSQVRDQATIDFLAHQVPNPFVGLLPTGFTGATVARSQLLRPFPQFNNVPTFARRRHQPVRLVPDQAREALQQGYSIIGTYTWSHFTERVFRLNATDAELREAAGA